MYWSTAIHTHFLESSVKSLTYKMDNTERVLSPLQVGLCWETISSNPTFSEQVVQGSIQSGFEYLHWWWLHRLTEQCAPMFHHPHLTKQTNMFRWNSMSFNSHPLPLVLSLGTTEKNLASSSSLLSSSPAGTYIDGNPPETLVISPPKFTIRQLFLCWEDMSSWKVYRHFRSEWQCHDPLGLEAWTRLILSEILKIHNLA